MQHRLMPIVRNYLYSLVQAYRPLFVHRPISKPCSTLKICTRVFYAAKPFTNGVFYSFFPPEILDFFLSVLG